MKKIKKLLKSKPAIFIYGFVCGLWAYVLIIAFIMTRVW